jgi:hypothetical protein
MTMLVAKQCFVCQGTDDHVSEMTDGRSRHLVCDSCRQLVNTLFVVYGSLGVAVLEAAQAKRGFTGVVG